MIVLGGLDMTGNAASSVVFVGLSWVGLGHIAVVASFKSAALRIGASTDEFSKLIWLPLAGVCYRLFVSVVLDFVDPEFRTTPLLLGLGVVGGLFLVGIALSTWRATESFDAACRRLNTRNFGAGLPSVDVITSALRKVNT